MIEFLLGRRKKFEMVATAIDLLPCALLRDEDCQHAEFPADSRDPSGRAAVSKTGYILYLGVYFIAELADRARVALHRMLEI
ncbi:MAG TPA: hypothetical protein VKB27_09205 [Gammaproteobacteria bacterium]|nr:hypothetical protein [Gammaproteobacteria bacterium]